MTTSYMDIMHNRYRAAPRHRPVQPFFPIYTIPPVARLAKAPEDNPPAFIPGTNVPAMGAYGCGCRRLGGAGCGCEWGRGGGCGFGSYYESTPNYYRNPVPYVASDVGAPVPGWGVNPLVAGPARIGVGATFADRFASTSKIVDLTSLRPTTAVLSTSPAPTSEPTPTPIPAPPAEVEPARRLPWWLLPVGAAVVVGVGGYVATKKGLI